MPSGSCRRSRGCRASRRSTTSCRASRRSSPAPRSASPSRSRRSRPASASRSSLSRLPCTPGCSARSSTRTRRDVWLVNTGWTGGPFGEGQRMPIQATRTMLRAALSGELDARRAAHRRGVRLRVPVRVPGVDSAAPRPALDLARSGRCTTARRASSLRCSSTTSRSGSRTSTNRFAPPARRPDDRGATLARRDHHGRCRSSRRATPEILRELGHEPVAVITPRRRAPGAPPMPFAAAHVADDPRGARHPLRRHQALARPPAARVRARPRASAPGSPG